VFHLIGFNEYSKREGNDSEVYAYNSVLGFIVPLLGFLSEREEYGRISR
jgi:hypothetical protein